MKKKIESDEKLILKQLTVRLINQFIKCPWLQPVYFCVTRTLWPWTFIHLLPASIALQEWEMDEKCSTHCWAHRKCLQNSLCYARGVVTNGVLLPNSTVGRGCPVWSIALDSWCRCKWSHDIDLEPCSSWERCFTLPQAGLQLSDVGLNKEDKEGDLTINTHLSLAHLPKDWISESLILGNSVFCRSFSKC